MIRLILLIQHCSVALSGANENLAVPAQIARVLGSLRQSATNWTAKRTGSFRAVRVAALALLIAIAARNATSQGASLQLLGVLPGGTRAYPADVSDDGRTVVGSGYPLGGNSVGFMWTPENGMVELGNVEVFDVSSDGTFFVGVALSGAVRGTLNGGLVPLARLPDQAGSTPFHICDDGTIAGAARRVGEGDFNRFPVLWPSVEEVQALDGPNGSIRTDLNDAATDCSIIAGNADFGDGSQGYRGSETSGYELLGDLPGGSFLSTANAMSDDGSVVVGMSASMYTREAYRWTHVEGMVPLLSPEGAHIGGIAHAMSGNGSRIAGEMDRAGDGNKAFVWQAGIGTLWLSDVLQDKGVSLDGVKLEYVNGMSRDGRFLIGLATGDQGIQPFLVDLGAPSVLGDTDADGDVDLADLNNVRNHFGGTGLGDTNGDGLVDLVDLNNVRNHFGESVPSINPVPEPPTWTLAVAGVIAGILTFGRRNSEELGFPPFSALHPTLSVAASEVAAQDRAVIV